MQNVELANEAAEAFSRQLHEFDIFQTAVRAFFEKTPALAEVVHTVKGRLKDPVKLAGKIQRKGTDDNPITPDNIFARITDLAGIRVLHLYQDQFPTIHAEIIKRIESHDWVLFEDPKAYTWDPESVAFFEGLGLHVEKKESFYTSIHYVIRPRADSFLACEIQVRTLFEEIWGEIDHKLNYPDKCEVQACKEQILVLSKLVGAGSRLADSIFRSRTHPVPVAAPVAVVPAE